MRLPAFASMLTLLCMVFPPISFMGPQNAGFIDTLTRANPSYLENGLPDMVIPLRLENEHRI